MEPLLSRTGVPYWPNEGEHRPLAPPRKIRSPIIYALVFFAVFLGLQWLWDTALGSPFGKFWIDVLTVRSAVALIDILTPHTAAVASDRTIAAPGGGLNVLPGCDGTDLLFLLTAAFVVCPIPWMSRLRGIAVSLALVFVLNEIRILALFYAARADKSLFDLLHTIVAPVVLITIATLFFYVWVHRAFRRLAPPV
ncbi:MAG TPA: exosortase/archaeosortase family protein [Burkholderiales bacterium]|nr:exosortase/archaeosortase family protein [Burkholderiales bacterium]